MIRNGTYSEAEILELVKPIFPASNYSGIHERLNVRLGEFEEDWSEYLEEFGQDYVLNESSVAQAQRFASNPVSIPSIFALGNGNIRFVFDAEDFSLGLQFLGTTVQVVYTDR